MTTLTADDCNFTATEMDKILTSLVACEAAGASGRDCVCTLDGTNAVPGATGVAHAATLVTAGWTVTINT